MLNNVMLVGRLVQDPEVQESESGKKRSQITLAVNRPYKNEDGVYETDFIDCVLWDGIALNTSEYCKKGDVVGVRGRLQTSNYETEDGEKKKATQIIVEKLTFLSSKHHDMSEDKSNDDDMDM